MPGPAPHLECPPDIPERTVSGLKADLADAQRAAHNLRQALREANERNKKLEEALREGHSSAWRRGSR